MKIFLTGGSGMVGRNIIALAQKQGDEIVAPTHQELNLFNLDAVEQMLRESNLT